MGSFRERKRRAGGNSPKRRSERSNPSKSEGARGSGPSSRRRARSAIRRSDRSKTGRTSGSGKEGSSPLSEQLEEMEVLKKDLDVASQVQVNFLPKQVPQFPNLDISAFYRPSKEVGGDYYDFIHISSNRLAMTVADVSGKGIAGSMVMAMFRSVLRLCAPANIRARDTLIKTNELASRDIKRGMFVTCLYTILNLEQFDLRVCSAGHNPLVLWRQKTRSIHLINPNGIAIGFDKGPVFENIIKEQRFHLEPGDRIVLYTDGVVEAMNVREEMYGEERFYRRVQSLSEEPSGRLIDGLVEDLDRFTEGAGQSDDITILTLRREMGGESVEA